MKTKETEAIVEGVIPALRDYIDRKFEELERRIADRGDARLEEQFVGIVREMKGALDDRKS